MGKTGRRWNYVGKRRVSMPLLIRYFQSKWFSYNFTVCFFWQPVKNTHTHTVIHSEEEVVKKNDIEMKGKKGRERSEDLGVMAVLLVILVFFITSSPVAVYNLPCSVNVFVTVYFCWHVCLWQIRKSAIKSFPGSASCFLRERERERFKDRVK